MQRARWTMLAVTMILAGCRSRHAPPASWKRRIDVSRVGPACLSLIGRSLPMRPVNDPRAPISTTTVDVNSAVIPAAVKALHPLAIEPGVDDVNIVLGRYPTPGGADDEFDHYGLVCSTTGRIPAEFQTATGTFLVPLAPGLWTYDGVL